MHKQIHTEQMAYLAGAEHQEPWPKHRLPNSLAIKHRPLDISMGNHSLDLHRVRYGPNRNAVPSGVESNPRAGGGIESEGANVAESWLEPCLHRNILVGVGKANIPMLEAGVERDIPIQAPYAYPLCVF